MMGLPDGRKRFKIGLAVLIQYRPVTDSHPASHVAVACTRDAYLRRAVNISRVGGFSAKVERLIAV